MDIVPKPSCVDMLLTHFDLISGNRPSTATIHPIEDHMALKTHPLEDNMHHPSVRGSHALKTYPLEDIMPLPPLPHIVTPSNPTRVPAGPHQRNAHCNSLKGALQMDLSTLNDRIQALETRASDLGFAKPEVQGYLRFCGNPLALKMVMYRNDKPVQSEMFKAPTPESVSQALHAVSSWLETQQTPAAAREADFQQDLARLVETGREIGSPILPDLEATMKRLSENVLTCA